MRDRDDTIRFLKESVERHDSYLERVPDTQRFLRIVLGAVVTALVGSGGSVVLTTVRQDEQIDELRKQLIAHSYEPVHTAIPELRQALGQLEKRCDAMTAPIESAMKLYDSRLQKLERRSRRK